MKTWLNKIKSLIFANGNTIGNGKTETNGNTVGNHSSDDGSRIYSNKTQRERALSERSHIRVFEIGLSDEFVGNPEESTRNQIRQTSSRLIEIAKANGLYIPWQDIQANRYGRAVRGRTGESIVYINNSNTVVTKVKDPFAKLAMKGDNPKTVIYDHIIHNLLFQDTVYTFEGISSISEEARIILSQAYVYSEKHPGEKQIDDYFTQRGFIKQGYYYSNEYFSITDVGGDNVLLSDEGKLYFIDPIITLVRRI